ncbi:phosphoadenosine phosphosulfate reductase family protein [Ignicoccus hospitalis]|uniref:Phosphoadenosine phosphosulfate reductase n=1 Tax=Ignicoccus hospitalis (strain KIN4/I / DSM 18386 / JCM 14125) TaxID=453591 RepID=A8AAE7_IGNH4|nr:phosphoadenosine phosphosulfate reductase family protein [Ignicoccus hospitalis]ABU81899.1 phosphoadenosine phosphosulfate reductase [Ignicoccus hospitalis KIN4/I]HIH89943.1 phosphoadenosine phosphosulfate reductase family protein [Desulfurococcaceae archaeon]
MKKGWNVKTGIVWDVEKNVPTFKEDCWDCETVELPTTLPGDARFAFEHDIGLLKEALEREFGDSDFLWKVLGGKGVVLVNKGAGLDDFRELFSRGAIVGKLYWEPIERTWRFRPSYAGASVLVELGVAKTVEVEEHPSEGSSIFYEGCKDGEQVILVNREKVPVGVGVCRKGRVRVITSFPKSVVGKEPFPAKPLPTTIEDTIKFNERRLRRLTSQSKRFIYSMVSKVEKPLTVSFSGGKDSLVALHLTLEFGKPIVVFNNTGIEMPETVETVRRVVEAFDLELAVADAGNSFWEAMKRNSPPARDLRWCCKVTKLVPMAKLVKERWPSGTLNVVGQRAFESIERSKSPRVWRNKWFPQVLNIAPIHYWTQLDVWMYIFQKGLKDLVNPLYFKGFERIGCFMCPASLLAEFEFTKRVHEDLWNKWEKEVERWRRIMGLPLEWREYGLWRWLSPSSKKKSFMNKLGISYSWEEEYNSRLFPRIIRSENGDEKAIIEYSSNIEKALEDQWSILGKRVERNNVKTQNGHEITFSKNKVEVVGKNPLEEALVVDALIHRWYQCMKCKSCELWCPTGAIKVEERPKVDPERCVSCRLCVLECPIYEPVTDRVSASVILGRPDGWRRKTKKARKEVIKELKEAVLDDAKGLGGL